MQKKIIFFALIILLLMVGSFTVWKFHPPTAPAAAFINTAPLAQLRADVARVAPHFIDASKGSSQALTPEEQKIKDDVIAVFISEHSDNGSYYKNLWLDAVGKRYVLLSQPSAESSHDEVLDTTTGNITLIASGARYYLSSEGRDIALYIDTQALYTYMLDGAGPRLVAGSQLSGNETYHSGQSDFQLAPIQTYRKDSITISVFDSSQIVQNPDAEPNALQTMNKKVREVTYAF